MVINKLPWRTYAAIGEAGRSCPASRATMARQECRASSLTRVQSCS